MPIETPSGVLEVENAKLRASSIEATIAVGIGTESNDAYPLQVFKETEPDIRIQEGSTISSASRIYSNNSNLYIQTGSNFTSGSSGDVAFQTMEGASTHMVIKGDGNVGIGTGGPSDKLHIYTDDTSGAQLFIENASASNRAGLSLVNGNGEGFQIQHTVGGSNAAIIQNSSTVNGGVKFYAKGDGGYEFRTTDSNTQRFNILNNGNVGIGVASPGAKLDVNGAIQANSIKTGNSNLRFWRISGTFATSLPSSFDVDVPQGFPDPPTIIQMTGVTRASYGDYIPWHNDDTNWKVGMYYHDSISKITVYSISSANAGNDFEILIITI